jgi:hypothetical protein
LHIGAEKSKGTPFGKQLINDMITNEKDASGFATVALENHWSPWMKKDQMKRLGFRAIDDVKLRHKTEHTDQTITAYLMWLPKAQNAHPPKWNTKKTFGGHQLLHGTSTV